MQYKDILQKSLAEENVKGTHLKMVNYDHIKSWGIKDFGHKEALKKHISLLTN